MQVIEMTKRFFSFLLMLTIAGSSWSKEIHVSVLASTSGDGSEAFPYPTIQAAATVAKAGDEIIIHAGIYCETVTPANSGTTNARITYKVYNNDRVIIDATNQITNWDVYKDNIYRAKFTLALGAENQIFVDEKMAHLARWPNVSELSINDPFFVHENYSMVSKSGSAKGIINDPKLPAMPENYYKGATLWCNFGVKWTSFGTLVTASSATKLYYSTTNDNDHYPFAAPWGPLVSTNKELYFLSGKFEMLDAYNEWFYRNDSIYLMVKEGVSLEMSVRAKKRLLCFNLNDKSYITIKGVFFFGGAITMNNSKYCVLDAIQAKFLTHHAMVNVKPYELRFVQLKNRNGINMSGESNSIINSTIKYSAGSGITIDGGSNHLIDNNDIQYCNYVNQYCEGINSVASTGINVRITRNKIWYTGGPLINAERGDTWKNNKGHFIAYNDLGYGEQLGDDRGGINGSGYEVCFNWIHHIGRGMASSIVPGLYTDVSRDYATYHHNVIWNPHSTNTTAHILINNTGNPANGNQAIFVFNNTGWGKGWEQTMTAGLWQSIITDKNNLCNPPSNTFVNVVTANFRLNEQATNAIDKGVVIPTITDGYVGSSPDRGAYEYGAINGGADWSAGNNVEMHYDGGSQVVAIAQFDKSSFVMFPNPAYSVLYFDNVEENSEVVVIDLTGKIVMRNLLTMKSIDISRLPNGLYLIQITNNKGTLYRKLLKQ